MTEVHGANVTNSPCLLGSFASVGSQYYRWSTCYEAVKPGDINTALGDQKRLQKVIFESFLKNSSWVKKGRSILNRRKT